MAKTDEYDSSEIINIRVKPTAKTTLAKLSVFDQIKMILHNFATDDAMELNASEKLSKEMLKHTASLQRLIGTAAEGLEKHDSVTLALASKYIPYLDAVIDKNDGLGRFYNVEIIKPKLPIALDYQFILKIEKKVD